MFSVKKKFKSAFIKYKVRVYLCVCVTKSQSNHIITKIISHTLAL